MLENPKLNTENVKIKRALISVFDKTNLAMLGKELSSRGIEILSTGGSASFLREKNMNYFLFNFGFFRCLSLSRLLLSIIFLSNDSCKLIPV